LLRAGVNPVFHITFGGYGKFAQQGEFGWKTRRVWNPISPCYVPPERSENAMGFEAKRRKSGKGGVLEKNYI